MQFYNGLAMKVSIKKLPKSKVEIFFEVSWEEFQPFLERAAVMLIQDLNLKGFRVGKVPRLIAEKEIGEDKILARAGEVLIKEKYPETVLERKLEVIGIPTVEILKLAKNNPFNFKVKAELLPEFSLPDYKKIASKVEKKEISLNEKEVDDTLRWLRESRAEFQDLKTPAKKGDFLEIEYQSPRIEGGKIYQDRFFLGKGSFLEGFEENIEGMKESEEKEFKVSFPTDYQREELASKDVNFKVKVEKVQSVKIPELNDDFARSLGVSPEDVKNGNLTKSSIKNLEDLKKNIKEGILKEKEVSERERRRNEILERIGKNMDIEIPEVLISLEKQRMMQNLKESVERELKISFKEYLEKLNKKEEDLKESFLKEAEKRVKNLLILREIGKREEVKVQEEEVNEVINDTFRNYPGVEKAKKEIDLERLKDYYKSIIYNEKVMQLLTKASPKGEA